MTKILNLHNCVVKSKVKISQNFVALSEYMNLKQKLLDQAQKIKTFFFAGPNRKAEKSDFAHLFCFRIGPNWKYFNEITPLFNCVLFYHQTLLSDLIYIILHKSHIIIFYYHSKMAELTTTKRLHLIIFVWSCLYMFVRDPPRFLDQVGHRTINVSIWNKHFFH